jgi:hypothetical protein
MSRFRILTPAVLAASLACAGIASAAAPHPGTYRAATSQKNGEAQVALDVRRIGRGHARVSAAELRYTLACEDGSSITLSTHLAGAKITRAGRFSVSESSGGAYGPHGVIRLTVTVSGRFTDARHAEGSFAAAAAVTSSPIMPTVACVRGNVPWASAR